MLETLGQRFPEAVHHCHRCLHALVVRELHDLEPAIGSCFLGGDDVAHALNEDLSAPARNRIEARAAKLANDLDRIHTEQLREEIDLARTEAVDVDRMIALDVLHQIQVPLERDIGVVPALNQDLDSAKCLELVDLGPDLLEGQRVTLAMFRPTGERAKPAIGNADIGVINVAVDDVRHHIAGMFLLTDAVGLRAQLEQRGVGIKVEKVAAFAHAAGRKVSVPLGILPRSTSRR